MSGASFQKRVQDFRWLAVQRAVPWCSAPNKWEPRPPINESAGHDCGHIWRKKNKTIADALHSKVMSKLAQLRARDGSRIDFSKDGWRSAFLFKTVAVEKNRIASLTTMLKTMELGGSMWMATNSTRSFCVRALNQTPPNFDGTNDAKATKQRRRVSSRSQQLRNGICAFRRCQDGLHTDESSKKNSSFGTGDVPWSPSRSESCVFKTAQDLIIRRCSSHETLFASVNA